MASEEDVEELSSHLLDLFKSHMYQQKVNKVLLFLTTSYMNLNKKLLRLLKNLLVKNLISGK